MPEALNTSQKLLRELGRSWKERCAAEGFVPASRELSKNLWGFLRQCTPEKKKQMYGDADYDWDYRVNTTSAAVGWRARLMGQLNSAYQPTEPGLFHEMMQNMGIDFCFFTFIDIGSGKGRALMMAADYPFQRIIGIELLGELHRVAQDNLRRYQSPSQRCFQVETLCTDARMYEFPLEPLVIYLFNPLPEPGLIQMVSNLADSLREHPRPVYVVYHNPVFEKVLTENGTFERIGGTHQFSLYSKGRDRR
jgi:hypothetical protein